MSINLNTCMRERERERERGRHKIKEQRVNVIKEALNSRRTKKPTDKQKSIPEPPPLLTGEAHQCSLCSLLNFLGIAQKKIKN